MKQGKNKCMQAMCTREHVFHGGATRIRLHFLQVPGCGVAKCTASEDIWEAEDEEGEGLVYRIRGGRRVELLRGSKPVPVRCFFKNLHVRDGRRTWELKVSHERGLPNNFTNKFYHALQTATSSVHDYKAILSESRHKMLHLDGEYPQLARGKAGPDNLSVSAGDHSSDENPQRADRLKWESTPTKQQLAARDIPVVPSKRGAQLILSEGRGQSKYVAEYAIIDLQGWQPHQAAAAGHEAA
eukprot:1161226-Pelagomonas_calceolata.AAC.5